MAKIWLKIWLKVKENGTKKIKLAKMVAKEKEILVWTLIYKCALWNINIAFLAHLSSAQDELLWSLFVRASVH